MYRVLTQDSDSVVKFIFPDFRKGWAQFLQEEKQKDGERDFIQDIARKIEAGEKLVAMDHESSEQLKQILSWDICMFWKRKWSNWWKRHASIFYDQPVGSFEGQEVWLLCEPIWTILANGVSREEAIRRMCDPKDPLKFDNCGFGSANWTEFAELFGQTIFQNTDQEEQFNVWYQEGWKAFEKTVDRIVEIYHKKEKPNGISA